jgi:hypothetical protein
VILSDGMLRLRGSCEGDDEPFAGRSVDTRCRLRIALSVFLAF